jgi:uncharacterized protein involved in outer membrane biogenesis
MKKVLLWILGIVVVLLVGVTFVAMFHLGGIIKTGVETMGPKYTGSSVTLESAYLRPVTGIAKLKGLVVGNPKGFKTPSAIRLGELSINLEMASLSTDTIIIESIVIDGLEITMEGVFGRNNLKAIMEHVEAQAPAKPAEGEAEPQKPAGKTAPGKKVVIKDLVVSNGKIGISGALMVGKQLSLPLPTIHLTGLGEKSAGVTVGEAISLFMDAIMKSAFSAVGSSTEMDGKGLEVLGDRAGAALGAAGGAAEGALNKGITSGGEALSGAMGKGASAAGDSAKKLGKGIGKLTGGLIGGSGSKDDDEKEDGE